MDELIFVVIYSPLLENCLFPKQFLENCLFPKQLLSEKVGWSLLTFPSQVFTNTRGWRDSLTAKSLQSCPTLCDPMDDSPSGSSVPGILQARTLDWVAISFSNAWKWKVKVKSLSRAWLLATPWTAAYQAPPSKGFSRQEYWSGVPLPSLKGIPWWSTC